MKLLVHRRAICLGTNITLFSKDDKNHSICAALGCNALGTIEISLKINDKSITILVCEDCKYKFKEWWNYLEHTDTILENSLNIENDHSY